MTAPINLFADLPARLPDELVTTLLEATNVRIERIVSHGHASPEGFWYDQDQHEWVVVLAGAARLKFEDGTMEMAAGDVRGGVIERCGHWIGEERPEFIAAQLSEFFGAEHT